MIAIPRRCSTAVLLLASAALLALAVRPAGAGARPTLPARPEVQALLDRVQRALDNEDLPGALQLCRQAAQKANLLHDREGEAFAFTRTAVILGDAGRPEQALVFYRQALPMVKGTGDQLLQAAVLAGIGRMDAAIHHSAEALAALQRARTLFHTVGNRWGEAATLQYTGELVSSTGSPEKAVQYYRQAVRLYGPLGDRRSEATVLSEMGNLQLRIGQPEDALGSFILARQLYKALGETAGEGVALNNIGSVYLSTGRMTEALNCFQQALPLRKEAGDVDGEGDTLNAIGTVYHNTGWPDKALDYYQQALPLYQTAGDEDGKATTLNNVGFTYENIGRAETALQYFEQALPLMKTAGDRSGEAATLDNIGTVYDHTGQADKAVHYYQQAYGIYRAAGDKRGEAATLNNIGLVYGNGDNPEAALRYYVKALPLVHAAGDRAGEARTLNNIGQIYFGAGEGQKALAFYQRAVPLLRETGDRVGLAITLTNMAWVSGKSGQQQTAIRYLQQALALQRAAGDQAGEALTLASEAISHVRLGKLPEAQQDLSGSVEIYEQIRRSLAPVSTDRQQYLSYELAAYDMYIDLLLRQQKFSQAFEWAQKVKARTLLDQVSSPRANLLSVITPEENAELQKRNGAVSLANQALLASTLQGKAVGPVQQQLQDAAHALQDWTEALYARHPSLDHATEATTVTVDQVGGLLPPDTALLEYVHLDHLDLAGEEKTRTVLFCVTTEQGKAVLHAYTVAASEQALEALTAGFRAGGSPGARTVESAGPPELPDRTRARRLYDLLVGCAAVPLAGKTRLIVCPDGNLWGLPFQALVTSEGAYLVQRYEVDYAYSATALDAAMKLGAEPSRQAPSRSLLCLANPDFGGPERFALRPGPRELAGTVRGLLREGAAVPPLPYTAEEAKALQEAYPDARIYTGRAAQKSTVLKEAAKFRYLHFATHGIANDTTPMQSCIVLAEPPAGSGDDGLLTASDIAGQRWNADLAVLSACDTARGRNSAGEGVVGLSWAMAVAGVPAEVVSQWSVDDASTAELMGAFYRELKSGKQKGEALRAAELELLQDGHHSNPFYWAPFVLMGDWR